ncbi:ileal sodium/bile acid cotransporter-like [Dreissena polymorpha]|uniref:Ileal sodium/bile acid cotransporter n=1 Tax=Dreissena polymorpha TaxID=45954 RepID=A0A9D4E9P0_DREPO|nr:ileal sodium/bile acid cotransporter-like [Dreissena polymorpha]KAH3776382.1 hypothetical protein DPMN_177806 [Dreissena polymorpha]
MDLRRSVRILRFLTLLLIPVASNDVWNVTFNASEPIFVFMLSEQEIALGYNFICYDADDQEVLTATLSSSDTSIFSISGNETTHVPCVQSRLRTSASSYEGHEVETDVQVTNTSVLHEYGVLKIKVNGKMFGLAKLRLTIHNGVETPSYERMSPVYNETLWHTSNTYEFSVVVRRKMRPIDQIFTIIVGIVVIVITMGFGCKLDLKVVKECIRRPVAPGVGFGCQYIVMPLLGYGIARLVPVDDPSFKLGIFLCGVCPGGGQSNIFTYLLDGDVSLSITMTFISTVASIGMMPLWLYTLGRTFLQEDLNLTIPYLNILQVIASLVIPLLIGIFLKYKFIKVALVIIRFLKPFTLLVMIVFLCVGLYANWYVFKLFKPVHILAGCLLPYGGYLIGGFVAAILRQPKARVITIALETGMQNMGVALLVLMMSLPSPLSDIAMVGPMASGMMTPMPALVAAIGYALYKKCCKKYEPVALTDEEMKVNKKKENGTVTEKLTAV